MNMIGYSNQWFTPSEIIDLARSVLGEIDLDPFSSEIANARLGAAKFYDGVARGDGFIEPWAGRVFCNPPGPNVFVRRAWGRMMEHARRGALDGAIWLSFNIEDLRQLQPRGEADWISPLSSKFHWCRMIPRKRLRLVDGRDGNRDHPRYANAIVWVPPPESSPLYSQQIERWHAAAPMFGEVF